MASRMVDMVQQLRGHSATASHDMGPAPNTRYPSYAAPTADARLVTDYRPQCTKNIRTSQQFFTKKWMIAHAEDLIEESRRRHRLGSGLPMAQTVPPPAVVVHSTPFSSEAQYAHPHGIGTVRADAAAPFLFGTYTSTPTLSEVVGNRKNIATTLRAEGGRNARRGM